MRRDARLRVQPTRPRRAWADPDHRRLHADGARFVIDAFQQLFDATAPDFAPIYAEVRGWPLIEAGVVLAGEREFAAG